MTGNDSIYSGFIGKKVLVLLRSREEYDDKQINEEVVGILVKITNDGLLIENNSGNEAIPHSAILKVKSRGEVFGNR